MPVFVASDGTKFEDRNAWRRYEFETNYTFRNRTNETLIKTPGKISGQPFDLSDLENCEVQLLDQIDQVQVDNVNNSRLFIGPSSESVFVRNCSNCIITVACKQLRTRDCTNCTIYLYSLTDPIIETSSDIKFAPFNGAYCGLEQHFKDARLEPTNNHWSQVYDFNDPDKSGHNWCLLKPDEECAPWVVDVAPHVPDAVSLGPCVNPVPRGAGYIQYEESNSTTMKSFSIATTQMQAQQALEAQAAVTVCHAPPPALAMAPPPPQPVEAMAPPLPPPAPLQPPVMENQKVAVVEAPELLAPPPCPSGGCCSTLPKAAEPAVDAAVEKTTEALTHLTTSS